jgi:hypothetical protein
VSNELRGTVLKVGPHAMSRVKPRQARKGATVRRLARVPWEYLTGAGSALRSRDGRFEGGCTVIIGSEGERASGSIVCGGERTPLLPHAPPPFWKARRMETP